MSSRDLAINCLERVLVVKRYSEARHAPSDVAVCVPGREQPVGATGHAATASATSGEPNRTGEQLVPRSAGR
jgi:hypothetical protein